MSTERQDDSVSGVVCECWVVSGTAANALPSISTIAPQWAFFLGGLPVE